MRIDDLAIRLKATLLRRAEMRGEITEIDARYCGLNHHGGDIYSAGDKVYTLAGHNWVEYLGDGEIKKADLTDMVLTSMLTRHHGED